MEGFRTLLRSKIHRLTVTEADLDYEGSLTLPSDLVAAAGLVEYEAIHVWDVTNGKRIETYIMVGKPGYRGVCVNGAAAHLVRPGDIIIAAVFGLVPESAVESHVPKLLFVNEKNEIIRSGPEIAGPERRL